MTASNTTSLPAVSVLGIGAATVLGRDLHEIAQKLRQPTQPARGPLSVDVDRMWDTALSRQMRRADRFIRMAVMAAVDAWESAKAYCAGVAPERIGMILSSGFGPHCRGFRFLDGILDCGDSAASPTDFSHSVHGAPSAYISGLLGVRGPSINATDFEIGFEEVVRLAQCWLAEGACDRVLIGAVEELGEVLVDSASRMLADSERFSPGEGAVYLMLGPAELGRMATLDSTIVPSSVDLLIVEKPAIPPMSAAAPTIRARETVSFTADFGNSASGTAFGVLGALLSFGEQQSLGRVIRQDSQGPQVGKSIDTAATFRTSSGGSAATLFLERSKVSTPAAPHK